MNHLVIICGPTGIGKTRLAIQLARELDCCIISADSRQFFSELAIGTAVPSKDELAAAPHHFIHSRSIHEPYNASMYEEDVLHFLKEYFLSKNVAILAGGSGMYIDAVWRGIDDLPSIDPSLRKKWQAFYKERGLNELLTILSRVDPEYFDRVDRKNPKRILKALEVHDMTGRPYSSFLTQTEKSRNFRITGIGLNTQREKLYNTINLRVDEMMDKGLLEEARRVYPFRELTPLKTVGYRELFHYFEGKLKLDEAIDQIKNHTRAYARRQLTWFRRYPGLQWFEPTETESILQYIKSVTGKP